MSKKTSKPNKGYNSSVIFLFGILCIIVAFKAGESSNSSAAILAGIKSSDEPIGDIIQAVAALAGVLVAGYGIFVANDSAGKERKISALKEKVDKWEKIVKDLKLYEREIVIYFQKEMYRSELYGEPVEIYKEIGAAQKGDEVRKRIRNAVRNKLHNQGELNTETAEKFLRNSGDSGNTLKF